MIDDEALGITIYERLLDASGLQTFHVNREPIAIPPNDLQSIATTIDEHEVITKANIASELRLDDRMQAVVGTSHIDSLHIEINSRGGSNSKHRNLTHKR